MMSNKNYEKSTAIAHWHRAAKLYADYYNEKSSPLIHRFHMFVHTIPHDKKYRIIDAGCGTGYMLSYLLKDGHDAFGFDFSQAMVEQARQTLEKAHLDTGRVVCEDISFLDKLESSSVDYVLASGLIRYLSKEAEVEFYEKVYRVLKDNGFLLATYTNEIFDLWTFNRYTVDFFANNILNFEPIKGCFDQEKTIGEIRRLIANPDLPPKNPDSLRDKNLVILHNPLTIREYLKGKNFEVLDLRFYSWHPLPPLLKDKKEEEYRNAESVIETFDDRNWRGYFMAYEFFVYCKKMGCQAKVAGDDPLKSLKE